MDDRIPVTVLTGWLGAGKTTLLNRLLSGDHGRRFAVVINEFGAVGIDHELVTSSTDELFEMNNGCVCCTVRGDLIRTLHALLARRNDFDAVIIETTGLADPGPVAQTFFVDPKLRARLRLDSITTVVDAHHVLRRLGESREAVEQVAFADQIVLNKTDLADAPQLAAVEAALRRLNPLAPFLRTQRGGVDPQRLLGRGGFDLARIVALEPDFLEAPHVHDEHCGHVHGTGTDDTHHAGHGHGIASVSLLHERPLDAARVQAWLAALVAERGADILRAKGILHVAGDARRLVFQSVHMLLDGDWQRPWRDDEPRASRLVFIGRGLDETELQRALQACEARDT
ncbi:MAG TPA: GTP-binding protein [Burkholderiaceae bacterium]|nr:GTP-binding protein [Burkholderiaceae bacterium]